MKKFSSFFMVLIMAISDRPVMADGLFDNIFSRSRDTSVHWELKAMISLPAMRLSLSSDPDRKLNAPKFLGFPGWGFTLQNTKSGIARFSVTAAMTTSVDLTAGVYFGIWDNRILVGPGYALGVIDKNEKRPCLLVMTGIPSFFQ